MTREIKRSQVTSEQRERVPIRNFVAWVIALVVGAIVGGTVGLELHSDAALVTLGALGAVLAGWLSQRLMRRVTRPLPRYTISRIAARYGVLGLLLGILMGDALAARIGLPRGWGALAGGLVSMAAGAFVAERSFKAGPVE